MRSRQERRSSLKGVSMRGIGIATVFTGLLFALAVPALAQGGENAANTSLAASLKDVTTISWIIGALVFGYIFSVAFSALFANAGYPPNIARLGCWLGTTISLVFIAFVVFGQIVSVHLPIWILIACGIFVCLLGIILFATRRHATN